MIKQGALLRLYERQTALAYRVVRHDLGLQQSNFCEALAAGKPLPKIKAGNVLPMRAV